MLGVGLSFPMKNSSNGAWGWGVYIIIVWNHCCLISSSKNNCTPHKNNIVNSVTADLKGVHFDLPSHLANP